jgi:FkbM family methyltransferase
MRTLFSHYYRKLKKIKFRSQTKQKFTYEGYEIYLPSRHSIVELLKVEPFRNQVLRIAAEILVTTEQNHVVDVGANVGDTALTINKASRVSVNFSLIEPSEFFREYLLLNVHLFSKYEIIPKFVSPSFPIVEIGGDLLHWGGTAQVVDSKNSTIGTDMQISLHQIVREDTGLVKIDCDGQDTLILQNFLENTDFRPTIYFENTITDAKGLKESYEALTAATDRGYEFAIVSRSDGLVIWAGKIGTSHLLDLFWLQLNLRNMKRADLMYHTDILLVHKSKNHLFDEVITRIRSVQQDLGYLG